MAFAPDSLLDIAKVFAARAATVQSRRRHEASFPFNDLPSLDELIPEYLRAPDTLDPNRNGYLVALRICDAMPPESPTECNAVHRTMSLLATQCKHEIASSRKALCGYEASMDDLTEALDSFSEWQAPTPGEYTDLPELENLKRLGHALLLRGAVQLCLGDKMGALRDFRHALGLANRMRNCQGFLLHLLVGVALEVVVHKVLRQLLRKPDHRDFALLVLQEVTLEGRKEELVEIYRSEFVRFCIPQALLYVRPWKPVREGSPASFAIPNLAAQWAVADHPAPYNPVETVLELTTIAEVFAAWIEEGWSMAPAIEEMRKNYAAGWPDGVAAAPIARQRISMQELAKARKALLSVENPYGRLGCARTLHSACEVYRAALLGQLRVKATLVMAGACQLGHQPSCLEELVGNGHLDSIPIDPFTDQPLLYDTRDGAVWSPGPAGLTYAEAKKCSSARYDSPYWLKI